MYSTVVSCKSGHHIKDLRDKIFDIASQLKERRIGMCKQVNSGRVHVPYASSHWVGYWMWP